MEWQCWLNNWTDLDTINRYPQIISDTNMLTQQYENTQTDWFNVFAFWEYF